MLVQGALRNGSFRHTTGIPPGALSPPGSIESLGGRMQYVRGSEIYGEQEPAEYLYKVVSGAVRTYKILVDGRRQVCDFHFPGDFLGLETDGRHMASAEAIVDSTLLVMKRTAVMALARCDQGIAEQLRAMTSDELRRVQTHVVLLIKTARERVAAFLLEMADRAQVANQLDLPMSRQDIADYLGLTIETVSRSLTDLENRSAISLTSTRRVVLRNRFELARYSG